MSNERRISLGVPHAKAVAAFERLREFDATQGLRKPRVERMPRARSGKNKQREMPFQVRLVVALRRRLPEGSLVWHTPGPRGQAHAIYTQQMGRLPGMPDLFVLTRTVTECGREETQLLALECKAKRGPRADPDKDLSSAQEYIRDQLRALDVPFYVATDVDAVLEWIAQLVPLKPKKERG